MCAPRQLLAPHSWMLLISLFPVRSSVSPPYRDLDQLPLCATSKTAGRIHLISRKDSESEASSQFSGRFCRIGRNPLLNCFNETSCLSGISTVAIGRAGFPCTIVFGGTDFVTTLPAVTIDPRPIVTLGNTM